MNVSLSNKTIVISGGTSQLGRLFVTKALEAGAAVYFSYFQNKEEAEQLEKAGAAGTQVDFTKTADIEAWAGKIKDDVKKIDALIHNAAAIRDRTIQNMTEADWDTVLEVDLKAPYSLTKNLIPLFLRNKGSKIFFITSRVALGGGFGVSNYAAAKAGLIGMTKSLSQELGRRQILVNAINPGFMSSAMTRDLPEPVIARNLELNPLGKWSKPEEVANFLVYLCSDQMTQVTGQVLHFEGRKT